MSPDSKMLQPIETTGRSAHQITDCSPGLLNRRSAAVFPAALAECGAHGATGVPGINCQGKKESRGIRFFRFPENPMSA